MGPAGYTRYDSMAAPKACMVVGVLKICYFLLPDRKKPCGKSPNPITGPENLTFSEVILLQNLIAMIKKYRRKQLNGLTNT